MHVISERKLREFRATRPEAELALRAWCRVVRLALWNKFADVRETYAHVDLLGRCRVFNVGGNKYRIIAVAHFNRGKLFILHALTHEQYDRGTWKKECC
jgi:mRNA interferase HigB